MIFSRNFLTLGDWTVKERNGSMMETSRMITMCVCNFLWRYDDGAVARYITPPRGGIEFIQGRVVEERRVGNDYDDGDDSARVLYFKKIT